MPLGFLIRFISRMGASSELSCIDQFLEWFMFRFRWIFVIAFLLPVSLVYDTYFIVRNYIIFYLQSAPKAHDRKVATIQKQVRDWNAGDKKSKMCTARAGWQTMSFRFPTYKKNMTLVSTDKLVDILEIDTEAMTVRVEPMVNMGQLTRFLIPLGYTLPIVPELDDLTVGGMINGCGVEASGRKYGMFQHTCVSFEIVTADGTLVHASKEKGSSPESQALYYGIPWSHGTLGFLVAATIKIIPAKPFVKLTYLPTNTLQEMQDLLTEEASNKENEFVEGIQFTKEKGVVMRGRFSDGPPKNGVVNRIGLWHKPWFYTHVEQIRLNNEEVTEFIPLREYYHRHSKSIFWEIKEIVPFGNNVLFRWILGWMCPPKISLLKITTPTALRKMYDRSHVLQDMLVPLDTLTDAVELFDKELEVYPLWLCPFNQPSCPGMFRQRSGKNIMYLDIGAYGITTKPTYEAAKSTRTLEEWVRSVHGVQMLYADTYMNRAEFWQMFDNSLYEWLRVKYDCKMAFPDVYDKWVLFSTSTILIMQPQDFDSYRVPISKASGKESAFIIYVNQQGKRRFMNEQNHRYSPRNPVDLKIMSEYWKTTDQATKAYFKRIEESDHNSVENRAKRRRDQQDRRRKIAHEKPEEEYETRQTHRANVRYLQDEKLRARGPQFIPHKKRAWDANTLFEQDCKEYCLQRRSELTALYKTKFESSDPSNLAQLRDETFTFVGVNICGVTEIVNDKTMEEDLFTVPREISIVNFTLKSGITSVKTILLDAEPGLYHPEFNLQFQRDNIREASVYLGLKPPTYEQEKEDVESAWQMFKDAWGTRTPNSTEKARILCERKFLNLVSFTFNRMANICGMAEWTIHTNLIKKGLIPIEDFVLAFKDAASCRLSDKKALEKYIEKNNVPKLIDDHYCSIHIHQANDKDLRCQQARGAMAIHGLFSFLHDQKIFGFGEEYDEKLHNLCTEREEPIADPTIKDYFIVVGKRRPNRYMDFTLVPSITEKDPIPDTLHLSQFKRVFNKPSTSRRRQPVVEAPEDDDERPNEDEGGVDDGEDDSDEDGLPAFRRPPFSQNGFDQGSSFATGSNNRQRSFNQNNSGTTIRSNISSPHSSNQDNWVDPATSSRPATVTFGSDHESEYRGEFRPEPTVQGGFQNRAPSTNGFQFQGGFQNRPSSSNGIQSPSQGGFQNRPRSFTPRDPSEAQASSQIDRGGFNNTRASPPPRRFIPTNCFSKPINEFSPLFKFDYNVQINWRPYTGDITKERLFCPEKPIDPYNYPN